MKDKFLYLKLLLIALLINLSAYSQPSGQKISNEERLRTAKELFNAGKYGASLHEFEVLKELPYTTINEEDIEFYISMCNVEMGNKNGRNILDHYIKTYPNSPHINSAYFHLANAEFDSKHYKSALSYYQKIDRYSLSKKDLDEYCFKSGYSNLQTGDIIKAKLFFNELKGKQSPFAESAQFYRGHINFVEGKYEEALQEFSGLENSSQYSNLIPFYKAQIAYAQGNYLQVIEIAPAIYSGASEPRKTELSKILAISFYQLKKYDDAIPYIDHYLKGTGITPHEYYVAGFCYDLNGQTDKAIANLEKSIKGKDPISQNAYYNLAGLYIKKGDKKRAMVAFQNASDMNFDPGIRKDALFQYAKITYELDYSPFNEAIKAFDKYISEYPNSENNDEAYDYLVKVFMTTRNYKDALASLEKIKVKSPAIKKAYQRIAFNRGIEYFRDMKFNEAIKLFNKASEAGDNKEIKALAYYWRGEANSRTGNTDGAISDYKKFQSIPGVATRKEFPISNYNIAYILFNKDQLTAATSWFLKYLSANPDQNSPIYSDALNRIGDCYYGERNFNEAISYYEKVYETGGADADYALYQKAFCYGLMQNQQSKINDLSKLQSSFPKSSYLDDALFETGKAYEQLKDEEKAVASYQNLIQKYPQSPYTPKALIQLGLLAYNRNDFNASINYYKQVTENYRNSPESKAAMTGIKNTLLETNKVDEYISYARSLGKDASPSDNEKDSLTFLAAEKLYMAKDSRAKQELIRYLDKFPSGNFEMNAHFYKADCEYRDNNFEEAIHDYEFVLSQADNAFTENALINVSELLYKTDDYKNALVYYERLERLSSNKNNLLTSLTGQMRCNYELKNFNAVTRLGWKIRSMENIPSELDREASYKTAKALVELNDLGKALPLWKKLSADTKSLEGSEAKYRMCEYYYNSNKYKEAENEVLDFIDKNTPHQYWLAQSFILLAHNYEKQNDNFQAIHTLKSVIENYSVKDDGIISEAQSYLNLLESKDSSGVNKQASEK
jgi:TolA-binding protein